MADRSGTLFLWRRHGAWGNLIAEYARRPARAVVVLGDCELERPLDETLEPICQSALNATPYWGAPLQVGRIKLLL